MRPKYMIYNHSILRSLPLLMTAFLFISQPIYADIHIGGDVYGGGKNGAVGTGNTTSIEYYTAAEATTYNTENADAIAAGTKTAVHEGDVKSVANKESVTLTEVAKASTAAAEVVIYAGNVRTVFGGGMNGRVYGKTSVEICGGVIGGPEWERTIHGGVFGAGDGAQALVFGHDEVNIKGGTIYNNIYGGGNQAELVGSTKVTLTGGTIEGSLYGGARMADIEGRTYVNVDGANATSNLIVKSVYGGNDISGQIVHFPGAGDPSDQWTWLSETHYNELITDNLAKATNASGNKAIDNTWGTYVYTTPVPSTSSYKVFIGSLYGGGNGEYSYGTDGTVKLANSRVQNTTTNKWDLPAEDATDAWTSFTGLSKPDLKKTYLQLEGGVFGYVYGGGNNATVTESTDIYINNTTPMTSAFQLLATTADKMGLQHGGQSSSYSVTGTSPNEMAVFNYQFDRVFGGNNKADMSIQPHWYLEKGIINNLYSGGNAGNMTNADGIILNIEKQDMSVVNVYGGCRMADVNPGSTPTSAKNYPSDENKKTEFVAGSSARLYISAGKITNVYGGNDISGTVYGGTDVELHGAVSGDVYGGGNGSYVYTDKKQDSEWIDYYYNPGTNTLDALLEKRPNVQNSYVHIWGDDDTGDATKRVYVTGRVFCGGNSATLKGDGTNSATATFKIGKYVTMNGVYLGSNGENMVKSDVLSQYNNTDISGAALKNSKDNFAKYMEGVEVDIMPTILYDEDLNYTSQIGAFVCGGNKGSISTAGSLAYTLPEELVIFDRVVGGCNAANVEKTEQNPFHQGGVITATTDGPKVTLNVKSRLEPRVLDYEKDSTTGLIKSDAPLAFDWNTEAVKVEKDGVAAAARIFKGANIYGGCYESGHVNGGVVINIENDLISPNITNRDASTESYQIDGNNTTEANRTANVDGLRTQRDYIFTSALSAYGGGYGEQTEIWGDVTINLSKDAQILKVFGGGELGIVGKIYRNADGDYQKDSEGKLDCTTNGGHAYNTFINIASGTVEPATPTGATDNKDYFNVARVYGGGFQGVVTGNTTLYLGGGKVSEAIAGAANADIYGYTEMFIGKDLAGNYDENHKFTAALEEGKGGSVYGGNDFGGKIWGSGQHTVAADGNMPEKKVTSNTYVEYITGLVENSVFGGACGSYNYALTAVYAYPQPAPSSALTYTTDPTTGMVTAPTGYTIPTILASAGTITNSAINANTFVNVKSQETDQTDALVSGAFYGGGKGYLDLSGIVDVEQTYVLLQAASGRSEVLSPEVYGGGYYSLVKKTMVDAYTGNFTTLYGGTFGATADQTATTHLTKANYQNTSTTINTYPSFTTNSNITIYGSGGYVGTRTTNVNLFGGMVGEVYGGSFNEGYCETTNVNVFSADENANSTLVPYNGGYTGASTVSTKYIFGGSKGADPTLPCDVNQTNVKFHSSTAYVRGELVTKDGKSTVVSYIYGGNNFAGASKNTLVDVTVPVKSAADGVYASVLGGGNGINSVAGFTQVNLQNGAEVLNVYGGAAEGSTFNQYDLLTTHTDHNAYGYYYQTGNNKPYAHWSTENWSTTKHTDITIAAGATVRENAYGAGYGEQAVVAGNACITNYGTVKGSIYGGGYSGSVRKMVESEPGFIADNKQGAPSTTVNMLGGVAENIYGGGYAGAVGGSFVLKSGKTNEYEDKTQVDDKGTSPYTDYTATTNVNIGTKTGTTHTDGIPTILRSSYGGGEKGKVYGTANTTLYNGYVGYEYRSCTDEEINTLNAQHLVEDSNHIKPGEDGYNKTYETGWTELTSGASNYFPNLKLNDADADNLLKNNGNLFGAGYGEGAVTEKTHVQVYGGTIRNGLYGGGEIAAVGFATKGAGNEFTDVTIQHPGFAHVEMFDGLVCGSVFGGGRGFSYDLKGGVVIGSQFYSDGYTFGQTEVGIHGGVIGTDESLAQGDGNVFGGGNIGYVYSGHGTKMGTKGDKYNDSPSDGDYNGFYYKQEGGKFVLTEDCKVVVSPYCKVTGTGDITVNGHTYHPGEYVPTEDLNTITNITVDNEEKENPLWNSLDQKGIIIRNAVFAGGNVTMGSDIMFIETTTVFGNVTASLVDLVSKDLITLGNDDVGGLYGDGNLTFVDGYRELNISNYGTDYYSLNFEISYEEYEELNNRQRAYFSIQYKCKEDNAGHTAGEKVDEETYKSLEKQDGFDKNKWERAGFCNIYAGRMLNTIQRADFCGVFGSRMVMKGAQDRVPAVADYTKYTINRVGEVSLNQVGNHGNYFGMYSVVNYLGALSSDVQFASKRTTQSSTHPADGSTTYKDYKKSNIKASYRNNGESANIVAMASGVFLELVHEPVGAATSETKDYGPITGVIQLDLISVKTGEGGGYVYAKNEHGLPEPSGISHLTLTKANENAVTQESYVYKPVTPQDDMQTSGNFVHSTKRIVDDCFPKAEAFYGTDDEKSPAHYWYVKGDFYVYDQYISAYTGSSQSYAETINLPLVIQAASNGKLKIETIQTSKYAYFEKDKDDNDLTPNQDAGQQIEVGDVLYDQNEPISYWDYSQLTSGKDNFLDVTYVCPRDIIVGGTLSSDGESITGGTEYLAGSVYKEIPDTSGETIYLKKDLTEITAAEAFHVTNGVSNANGLVLAVSLDNPYVWDEYHTTVAGTNPQTMDIRSYNSATNKSDYILAPTYRHTQTSSKVYGQSQYLVGSFVPQKTVTDYVAMSNTTGLTMPSGQAVFDEAYVAKEPCDYTYTDAEGETQTQHVVKGGAISQEVYEVLVKAQGLTGKFSEAFVCTETTKLAEDKYVIVGETYGADEIAELQTKYGTTLTEAVKDRIFDEAYLCTQAGAYGGRAYTGGQNFSANDYTALNKEERENFTYNWDALDVLSNDTKYSTATMQAYDKDPFHAYNNNLSLYSKTQSLDYEAKYTGPVAEDGKAVLTKNDGTTIEVVKNQVLSNIEYEELLNEKANYVYLNVTYLTNETLTHEDTTDANNNYTYQAKVYINEAQYNNLTEEDKTKVTVNNKFRITNAPVSAGPILYDKGRVLTEEEYNNVNDKNLVTTTDVLTSSQYFCVKPYGSDANAKEFSDMITPDQYDNLKNYQKDFAISGSTPIEKSTLYVTKDINPFDVTQDRIVTVIYNYTFTEADEEGASFENVMERHVLNIHIHFENGVPTIGDLIKPAAILPGSTVGLNVPVVTPGAFDVLGGGFEIFESEEDAQNQKNGVDWKNYETPMYWYQNDWYVAYYAETYLGKTYSNAVPFTVANYHSMEKVMTDPTHLYIDRNDVMRDCRIYLDNHECKDNTKNDLDYLKEFFEASLKTGATGDNKAVFRLYDKDKNGNAITPSPYIMGGNHLQFYLNSDITAPSGWTALGTDAQCFEGNFHGNGHTISGLTKSLFSNLCGSVYNLGVKGAIDGSGIADKGGYAENCWLINENTSALSGNAVLGTGTIANCYFNDDVASTKYSDGTAIRKPMSSFLNGEVAYNLNRFYLRKRYADATTKGTSDMEYKYWALNQNDNTLTLKDGSTDNPLGHYPDLFADPTVYEATCSSSTANDGLKIGYVENQFLDGDYIYANGKIPEKENERYDKGTLKHYPIYPDDYIFFGQKLTYNTATHNATPTAIKKTVTKDDDGVEHERIERSNKDIENRVYRAPAYFRSKEQSKAYYNRDAAFVAQYTPTVGGTAVDIHKGMTAIDFTAYNDAAANHVTSTDADDKTYAENQDKFYAPWLDYEGLSSIKTDGLTKNLLAYAKAGSETGDVDNLSAGVLNAYFTEPVYKEESETYRNVKVPDAAGSVKGHVVLKDDDGYTAFSDHYLVDKQDFNAPIAYTFDSDNRMWYQRKPLYATGNNKDAKGWEGVSLPFAAELVTTQTKGEITHFYEGSTVGHEYWLREYTSGGAADTENSSIFRAAFKVPDKETDETKSDYTKNYTNSFLYDWYYSKDSFQDKNEDEYQKGYYNVSAEKPIKYEGYAYGQAGVPYIAGFPGAMYYEFDLSGVWTPEHRINDVTIASPGAQTITFASAEGGSIGVSDDECAVVKNGSYEFVPTYLNNNLEAGKYVLNSEGSSFDVTTAATQSYAFRPYFQNAPAGVKGEMTRSIVFDSASSESLFDKDSEKGKELDGGLAIYAKRGAIVVSSTMKEEQPVSITNAAGITIANFMIQPGETRITPIHSSGVYIVNEKKLSVK